MKKLMIMAVAAFCSASAFAQNPDALKQIKKAKTADEVNALISTNTASMTAVENAQAYNKLVEVIKKEVDAAKAQVDENQVLEQAGQAAKNTVDIQAFYANVLKVINAGITCDKYDVQPNDKGKVSPKFRDKNAEYLYSLRNYMINAGEDERNAGRTAEAVKFYDAYITTGTSDMFTKEKARIEGIMKTNAKLSGQDADAVVLDPYMDQILNLAIYCAYTNKDYTSALKFNDVLAKSSDKKVAEEALGQKAALIIETAKTHADSLACLTQIEELYSQNPGNKNVFSSMASLYGSLDQREKMDAAINTYNQQYPDNFIAWALKGQNEMQDKNFDAAVTSFEHALKSSNAETHQKALVNTFIGNCLYQKAVAVEGNDVDQTNLVKKAMPYFETARELDPDQKAANWGYLLYNCYYHVYGEKDAKTQELKSMLGY